MNIIVNLFNYFYRTICRYICNPSKTHNITVVMHGIHMQFIHKCKQPEIASKASSPPLADPTHRLKRKSLRGAKIAVAIFLPTPLLPHPAENFFWPCQKVLLHSQTAEIWFAEKVAFFALFLLHELGRSMK